ncbi:MAG: formate hydrogenase [Leptospiraceae bacterium]|nr:formate hydrogenase [Leptospiraceae bacterium]
MIFDLIYLLLLLTGVAILIENRLGRIIFLISLQGLLLTGPVFQVHNYNEYHAWSLVGLILLFKTFLTPYTLYNSLKRIKLFEQTNPRFGYLITIFLFLLGLFAALRMTSDIHTLPVKIDRIGLVYVILLIYLGILTFIANRHWLVLIVGFIMFENGVFLLTLIMHRGLPFGIEIISFVDALLVIVAAVALQARANTYRQIDKGQK